MTPIVAGEVYLRDPDVPPKKGAMVDENLFNSMAKVRVTEVTSEGVVTFDELNDGHAKEDLLYRNIKIDAKFFEQKYRKVVSVDVL